MTTEQAGQQRSDGGVVSAVGCTSAPQTARIVGRASRTAPT
jgi:hypothetical protein